MKALFFAAIMVIAGASPLALAAKTKQVSPADQAYCEQKWRTLPANSLARPLGKKAYIQQCLNDCPREAEEKLRKISNERQRGYCEVRWTEIVAAHETAGRTHDEFIRTCAASCQVILAPVASQAGLLGGGAAGAAGLAGGAAAAGGGGARPASP